MSGNILYITENMDYQTHVVNRSEDKLVVVKFSAPWCAPCRKIQPAFVEQAKQNLDCLFCELNIDEFEEVSDNESVSSIPCFIAYHNKVKIDKMNGASSDKLIQFIKECKDNINGCDDF